MKRELSIPPDAAAATSAIEVFRGWMIDDVFQCSLLPTIWQDEPGMWGILMADAVHHVADAVAHTGVDLLLHFGKWVAYEKQSERFTVTHHGEFTLMVS